jgi:hypothetical protein
MPYYSHGDQHRLRQGSGQSKKTTFKPLIVIIILQTICLPAMIFTSRKNRLSLQACIVRGSLSAIRTILGTDPAHPATPAGWALKPGSKPRGTLFQPVGLSCRLIVQD